MSRIISIIAGLCLFMSLSAYSQEVGIASYYHDSLAGSKMANGDRYDPEDLTCAHMKYPLGTILKVARKNNPEHSVMVIVTDRGPYIKGRAIDLSKRAAREIGILDDGLGEVIIALVKKPMESSSSLMSASSLIGMR